MLVAFKVALTVKLSCIQHVLYVLCISTVCQATVHKYCMSSWGWVLRHAPQENVGSEIANYDEYFDIQNSFSNIIHTHIESTFIISYNTMDELIKSNVIFCVHLFLLINRI